jgi:nucleotidyltransferase substrate binding protein (TIGR01987 family)
VKSPDYTALRQALATLHESLQKPPANTLERDGVIQRFEYTFELAWKSMRRCLLFLGRAEVSGSPKPVIRDAFAEGLAAEPMAFADLARVREAFENSDLPFVVDISDYWRLEPAFREKVLAHAVTRVV